MLQLTPAATEHLVFIRKERGFDDAHGARFVHNGPRVGLAFVPAPRPGDIVLKQDGITVYIAPEAASKLDQAVIDVRRSDGRAGLVLRPRAAAKASAS